MAVKVAISFKDTEIEKAMYDFLQSQISPSYYLKSLIKIEMEKNGQVTVPEKKNKSEVAPEKKNEAVQENKNSETQQNVLIDLDF